MSKLKFYRCPVCGKIITQIISADTPTVCCGKTMEELIPGTSDAAVEKHVPIILREGGKIKVNVGSVDHPMTPEHYIPFIVLETENGFRIVNLTPEDKPCTEFLEDEKVIAVYAYCNLHGLWKTEI